MGDLLNCQQLNEKIQYELQEFHQLNYDSFIHNFVQFSVRNADFSIIRIFETNEIFSTVLRKVRKD